MSHAEIQQVSIGSSEFAGKKSFLSVHFEITVLKVEGMCKVVALLEGGSLGSVLLLSPGMAPKGRGL